jgi:hypothetical protein
MAAVLFWRQPGSRRYVIPSMIRFCILLLFLLPAVRLAAQDSVPAEDSLPKRKDRTWLDQPGKRLQVGLDIGYNHSYRQIFAPRLKELVDCRNAHESPAGLLQYGMALDYRVNKWLHLVTGVHRLSTGFNLEEELELDDTLPHEFGAACDVYGLWHPYYGGVYSGFVDPRYSFKIEDYHPSHATLRIKVRYTHIDVPVKAHFTFGKRRLSAFAAIGFSANYMLRQRIYGSFDHEGEFGSYTYEAKPPDFINRLNFSALGSVGTRIRITPKNTIEVYAGVRKQLRSIFSQDEDSYVKGYSEWHYSFSFGLVLYSPAQSKS